MTTLPRCASITPDTAIPAPDVAEHKPSRTGGGPRRKIDWDAAFAYYAADPTSTFGDVARAFGVSDVAVGRWARKQRWIERAAELRRRSADKAALATLEERRADTIAVASKLRALALADDADIDAKTAIAHLPAYAKLEELFAGEATDRVSMPDVRDLLVRLGQGVDVALRQALEASLSNGKRALVLREFRARFGPVLEEAASGLLAIGAGE